MQTGTAEVVLALAAVSVVELVAALQARGGGMGLFTGCAAGDSGAAVVLRVEC